jgi:hypothetical protein
VRQARRNPHRGLSADRAECDGQAIAAAAKFLLYRLAWQQANSIVAIFNKADQSGIAKDAETPYEELNVHSFTREL